MRRWADDDDDDDDDDAHTTLTQDDVLDVP